MSDQISMPIRSDPEIAMARAKLARFVAAAFSEPDVSRLKKMADPAVIADLRASGQLLGVETAEHAIFDALRKESGSSGQTNQLLGHTVRSECPPYELEYRTAEIFQQSQTLADIAGFYRAFGFDTNGPLMERADSFVSEWEFLSILAFKESRAGNEEQKLCCIDAERAFLEDHAAAWMPSFFERLRKADDLSFLAHVADLAEALLRNWCAVLQVSIGPRWLELRPISEEDSTITCGAPGTVELGPALAAAMEARDE